MRVRSVSVFFDVEAGAVRTSDFVFDLPEAQIATFPARERDGSRLLILDSVTGRYRDARFRDIVHHLRPRSVLVINDTQVIPARLLARKETGGEVEVLLVRRLAASVAECEVKAHRADEEEWEILVRGLPARTRPPVRLRVQGELEVTLNEALGQGAWRARFFGLGPEGVLGAAERFGRVPLPPYIEKARARRARAGRASAPGTDEVCDDP